MVSAARAEGVELNFFDIVFAQIIAGWAVMLNGARWRDVVSRGGIAK